MRRKRVTRTKMLKKAAVAFVLILCFIAGMFENLPYKQAGAESSDPRKAYEEKLNLLLKRSIDLINLIPQEIKNILIDKLNE